MLPALVLAAVALAPFDQVVGAERKFAAMSVKTGLHEAFLANLAPDSVSFNPTPEPARPRHTDKPPSKGVLDWAPAWVAVSSGGDLAISLGPWVFKAPQNPILGQETVGWFISVWKRQPDDEWKVEVDSGVTSSMAFEKPPSVRNGTAPPLAKTATPADVTAARNAVTGLERAIAVEARSGVGAASAAHADPEIQAFRTGASGRDPEAAKAVLAADKRKADCKAEKVVAAASADLVYAYGACDNNSPDKSEITSKLGFLHVWRKQQNGTWKLMIDVTP